MEPGRFAIRLTGDRSDAVRLVRDAPDGWTLTIRPPNRTLEQNARYWAAVTLGAQALGCSKSALHELLKRELLGVERMQLRDRFVEVTRSTATLSVPEFSEYIDAAEAFLVDLGVDLCPG